MSEVRFIFGPPGPGSYITAGYGGTARVILDKPARAEVHVSLSSDDASLVVVPPIVTVLPGRLWADFSVTTSPIRIPFLTKEVTIFASYAGTTVAGTVKLRPVRVVQAQFVPASVKCGDTTTLTVALDHASLLGDTEVTFENEALGLIETIPASVTIPQGQVSGQVTAVTRDFSYPVKTVHASVLAHYLDSSWGDAASSAEAELEIKSRVPGGILKSVVVVPSHITGGRTANGTVTLEEAAPVPTDVGLAALEPGHPGLPLDPSSAASVPASVTVPANRLSAPFVVETVAPPRGVIWSAVVMANAVATKTTTITIG